MAPPNHCLAALARLSLTAPARPTTTPTIPKFLLPSATAPSPLVRYASMSKKRTKKRKTYKTFRCYDQSKAKKFSLCDAIRYIRAIEVGKPPADVKYEIAAKLRTQKNGPIIRGRIRFPFAVKTSTRVGVICPEDSPIAAEAQQLGAVAVGEESLFESIRAGNITFTKLICHPESADALKKANLGKILGPKGMMPSPKTRTITADLQGAMQELIGADEYKEKLGVVRLAIGQLGFTPHMLSENLKLFMSQLKHDIDNGDEYHPKALDEVVLSSTNGPGFSLNGTFSSSDEKVQPEHLQSVM
ncbi:ribosomal protein L1-like protein [Staphylotrichum tortipilum]|uniref:Ribosomal protein L1-like protein n=1 Tax=Staphylotrichum tortipilum TaxID=2831512 RepID=A0AAN6RSQ8_9PEZI|nr:ribosomal protein L1-like protein [Staphylotrichum longicolle]